MGFQTLRMIPDCLKKIRNRPKLNLDVDFFLNQIWPEVPRRFPEVLRKDTEEFQNIDKTCWNIPILRIPLSEPFRGLVDGRS